MEIVNCGITKVGGHDEFPISTQVLPHANHFWVVVQRGTTRQLRNSRFNMVNQEPIHDGPVRNLNEWVDRAIRAKRRCNCDSKDMEITSTFLETAMRPESLSWDGGEPVRLPPFDITCCQCGYSKSSPPSQSQLLLPLEGVS